MGEMTKKPTVPAIRFKGFTDTWEQCELGAIIQAVQELTSDFENYPLYSLTIENGVTPKTERYERSFLITKETDLFKIVPEQCFVSNPMNLRFGAIGFNDSGKKVSVSGYYDVFSIDRGECSNFWCVYLKTANSLKRFDDVAIGSLIEKRRVHFSQLTEMSFPAPNMNEKKKLGEFFERLERLITLHQRKLDKLHKVKRSLLERMFPRNGANVPEIRFSGFTDAWEQRKLSEISDSFEYGLNAAATDYDGKHKYIRITDIDDTTHLFLQDNLTSPDIDFSNADDYLLQEGVILFARTGASVGKTYIYRRSDGMLYFAGFLIRAKIKSDYDADFVFQNTLTDNYDSYIRITSQRSGQPGVNAQEYGNFEISVPKLAEQQKIGAYFSQLDNLITLHQRKLDKLRQIKRSMLEKMFV